MKKISILVITLLLLGSVFASAGTEILGTLNGRWVQTGDLLPDKYYLLSTNDGQWVTYSILSTPGKAEALVDALNVDPVTMPPVYLYVIEEGVITPVLDPPWKWIPGSI